MNFNLVCVVFIDVGCFLIYSLFILCMVEKWLMLYGWSVKECVDKYFENVC